MKKIFFRIILCIILSYPLFSQIQKNEFYGSYGAASVQEIASLIDGVIILPFVSTDFSIESPAGPFIAGYRRNLTDNLGLGLQVSYNSFNQQYTLLEEKVTVENKFITAMIDGSYCYNPGGMVRFYSGLSVGLSGFSQKDSLQSASTIIPAFQVSAIGMRVGKSFGAFIELGFGYNGLISGGLTIKF